MASVIYASGDFTNINSDYIPANEKIICGYCDTNQDADNPHCQSCGGPLNDDITNRRNGIGQSIKFGITAQEAADAIAMMFG